MLIVHIAKYAAFPTCKLEIPVTLYELGRPAKAISYSVMRSKKQTPGLVAPRYEASALQQFVIRDNIDAAALAAEQFKGICHDCRIPMIA